MQALDTANRETRTQSSARAAFTTGRINSIYPPGTVWEALDSLATRAQRSKIIERSYYTPERAEPLGQYVSSTGDKMNQVAMDVLLRTVMRLTTFVVAIYLLVVGGFGTTEILGIVGMLTAIGASLVPTQTPPAATE